MLEIIQDVLSAEERAGKTIEVARSAAATLRSQFAAEESKRVRESQAAADQLVRESLARVRDEQDRRVTDVVEALRDSSPDEDSRPGFKAAVAQVITLVISGPGETGDT